MHSGGGSPRDPLTFADAVNEAIAATQGALAALVRSVKALQDDHATAREELYALTQRIEALEGRKRDRRL